LAHIALVEWIGIVADPVRLYSVPISRGIFMQESLTTQNAGSDERDQFIPIRKSDIISALTKSGCPLSGFSGHLSG